MIIKPTKVHHISFINKIRNKLQISYRKKRITYINANIKKIIKSLYEIDQDISDMHLYKDILNSRLSRYKQELNVHFASNKFDNSQDSLYINDLTINNKD